jgi:hypothetical protein
MRQTVVRHLGGTYPYREDRKEDFGTRAQELSAQDAAAASREMRERLEKVIFKFGWRHGITTDEARHLLLNTGVRLR